MSTQSPNFNLTIATTSDQVNVVTQIANNFSTLDTVLSVVFTSTGAIKPSTFLPRPQMSSPSVTGSMTGVFSITASTGQFNTVTATSGSVTVGYLGIGTYSLPTTVGATGALLTVVTGNAQWAAPSGGTGANTGLSNLASVAINTSLNSFTASAVTMSQVIATSGSLSGLTVFQATTGTFAGNLTVTGTLTANAVVCTGGVATFAGLSIGTYALPSTIGATGLAIRAITGNAVFAQAVSTAIFSLGFGSGSGGTFQVLFGKTFYDPASSASTTGYTTPSSGYYSIQLSPGYIVSTSGGAGTAGFELGLIAGATTYNPATGGASSAFAMTPICIVTSLTAGAVISATMFLDNGSGSIKIAGASLMGFKMYDW